MSQQEAIRTLTHVFRANGEARPVLLPGAGASFSSGVPAAAESVKRLAKRVYAEQVLGGHVPPEQVRLTEWQTWLHGQPWFLKGDDRLAENFPRVVQHLLKPAEYRKHVLLDLIQPTNGIGKGYQRLAELTVKGLVSTVLTTNFDTCLPTALGAVRHHIGHIAEVNRAPGDLNEFSLYAKAQVVWLHGRAEQYSDRNLIEEVQRLNPELVKKLVPLPADSPLVVIGYRGSEPSIMEHLLRDSARAADRLLPLVLCDTDGLEDERRGIISVFDGPSPEVKSHTTVAAEADTVRQAVETWLREDIAAHEIGVFVRTPQLVARAQAAINGLVGASEITTAPMSLAKGLEFRAVVVMACDEGILPLDGRVADAADEAELDDIYETETPTALCRLHPGARAPAAYRRNSDI